MTKGELVTRVKELEQEFFLIAGIVKQAKLVLAKQNPKPHLVDRGLPYEEWLLYISIEEYERLMHHVVELEVK